MKIGANLGAKAALVIMASPMVVLLCGGRISTWGRRRTVPALLDTPCQDVRKPPIHGLYRRLRTTSEQMGKAIWFRALASLSLRAHPILALLAIAALLIPQSIPALSVALLAGPVTVAIEPAEAF